MTKNIIYILLSVVVLSFSVSEFGYMFMSVPAIVTLSYYLSDLVLKIINKKYPNNRKTNKYLEYSFFIGLFSMFFVFRTYEDTIGGYDLFWKLSYLAVAVNLLVVVVINQFYNLDTDFKEVTLLGFCICFFLLVPNLGIFLNKNIASQAERKVTLFINYKNISESSRNGKSYHLFIKTKYDSNERLEVKKEVYGAIKNDQIIVLTLRKGILGYDYITKVDTK